MIMIALPVHVHLLPGADWTVGKSVIYRIKFTKKKKKKRKEKKKKKKRKNKKRNERKNIKKREFRGKDQNT